ncbi:hypothetical protein EBZ80_03535 [bacterium]|nr:hypothetical protein [bacterium]
MKHACLYKHLYEDLLRKQGPTRTTTEKRLLTYTRQDGHVCYRYEDVDAMLKTLEIVLTDAEIDWLFDHHVIIAGNAAMTEFFWVVTALASDAPPTVRQVAALLETDEPVYHRTVSAVTIGRGKNDMAQETRTSRVIIWVKKDATRASRL